MGTPEIDEVFARRRGPRLGREGGKIAAGILLIALVVFGQDLVGAATASRRLDPALANPAGPSNVVAVLNFTPERFHNERLATYGVFAGRDGAVNRVRLRLVTPSSLRQLARLAWVSRIEPLGAPAPAARPAQGSSQ
jgi:hypothetical protein